MGNSPREWNDGSAVRLDRQDPYLRLQSVMIFVRDLEQSLREWNEELTSKLDALTAQLQSAVNSELQAAGVHASGTPVQQVRQG